MADPTFVPLPPDVDYDSLPTRPPPGTPTPPPPSTAAPPQFTPLPPGAQFDAPYQPWKNALLPFSGSGRPGDWKLDWNAGLTGKALDAFTLPRNVITGQQQIYDPSTGTFDPSFIDRNLNFAQMASPMPAAVRATGQILPGVVGGQSALSGKQLQTAAKAGYKEAEVDPTIIPSSSVDAFGTAVQQRLYDDHRLVPGTAPKTFEALDNLANPTGRTSYIDLAAARSQLGEIANTSMGGNRDPFAARQAIGHLDNLIDPIYPAATTARGNQAAAFRASELTGDLTQANTGILERADTAAQLRARVKTLTQSEDRMRGFSDAEKKALNNFAKTGGRLPMGLSTVGDVLGSGFGKLMAGGAGAFLGALHGPGESITGFMAGPYIGESLKSWEAARASAQLEAIAQQLRSRSPLGESLAPQNIPTWPPSLNRIPSLLAPPQPPQSQRQFPPMQPVTPGQSPPAAPGPPRPTGEYFPPYGGTAPSRFPFGTPLPQGLLAGWA